LAVHDEIDDARSRGADDGFTGGVSLKDDRRQTFAMAWQDKDVRNRIIRRRVIHRAGENHAFMRLEAVANLLWQGIAVLKTSDEKQAHLGKLFFQKLKGAR